MTRKENMLRVLQKKISISNLLHPMKKNSNWHSSFWRFHWEYKTFWNTLIYEDFSYSCYKMHLAALELELFKCHDLFNRAEATKLTFSTELTFYVNSGFFLEIEIQATWADDGSQFWFPIVTFVASTLVFTLN